jgi:hypothetical protein
LFQVPLPLDESVFFHAVRRRHVTREIVQIHFKPTTAVARTWTGFGNHWPSRRSLLSLVMTFLSLHLMMKHKRPVPPLPHRACTFRQPG